MLNLSILYLVSLVMPVIMAAGLKTRQGTIYGRQTEHSMEYLGIQYAKAGRWQPPIDLAFESFSNGSFEATLYGPCCPQPDTGIYIPKQNEQCQYLNIFTPLNIKREDLLPVLVWVHGGGLLSGCSSQSLPILYNSTNIIRYSVQQPVIIVTINYRLGILTDMYLPELISENSEWPTAGNYNYLDILSALRWVYANIRDYGGNPNNILLFGESSGGKAIIDIGALKGSANLYHHIISQSAGFSSSAYYSNKTVALQKSKTITKELNCSNYQNLEVLECLRKISIESLVSFYGSRSVQSVIDGYFFPSHPLISVRNGNYNHNIDMIIGANRHEEPYQPDMNLPLAAFLIANVFGEIRAPKIIDHYRLNDCSSETNSTNHCYSTIQFVLNTYVGCSVRRLFNIIHSKYKLEQPRLFWYNMDCNPGICPKLTNEEGAGICLHAAELPLIFGTESSYTSVGPVSCTWDSQTRIYSNLIISHWINMATHGMPLKQWEQYDPSTSKYLQLTPFGDSSMKAWSYDCSLFDQMEDEDLHEIFGSINACE